MRKQATENSEKDDIVNGNMHGDNKIKKIQDNDFIKQEVSDSVNISNSCNLFYVDEDFRSKESFYIPYSSIPARAVKNGSIEKRTYTRLKVSDSVLAELSERTRVARKVIEAHTANMKSLDPSSARSAVDQWPLPQNGACFIRDANRAEESQDAGAERSLVNN